MTDDEVRWTDDNWTIKFSAIFLMYSILFPLVFGANSTDLVVRIFLFIPFLPGIILLIELILFHHTKQSKRFPYERQKTVFIIGRALEREGFNIRIIDYKNLIPTMALYNSQIIIEEETLDIRLFLKGIRLVSQTKAGVRENFFTHICIGPISPPMMQFIIKIQSIIDNEM